MADNTKMREAFEKWAVSEGMPITRGHYYDVYASGETRAAYLAWQAAQSVPDGYRLQPLSEFDAYQSVIDENTALLKDAERLPALEHTLRHLGRELAKLDKYRLCMSYNDSYFGEPVGTIKRVVVELRHCIDAAMQERKP